MRVINEKVYAYRVSLEGVLLKLCAHLFFFLPGTVNEPDSNDHGEHINVRKAPVRTRLEKFTSDLPSMSNKCDIISGKLRLRAQTTMSLSKKSL